MALLGLDGFWHVPRHRTDDATTSICGLRFIGEFEGRDDAELPLGEHCPDCTEPEAVSPVLIVPAPLVEAAVDAADAYQRGGGAELGGALAQLASEVERARDGAASASSATTSDGPERW